MSTNLLNIDVSFDSKELSLEDSVARKQAINVIFDSSLVFSFNTTIVSSDTLAELESILAKKPNYVSTIDETFKYKFKQNTWYKFNFEKQSFEKQKINLLEFKATGKKKYILGYPCSEAISEDKQSKIWFTDKLRNNINPLVPTKELYGAILEYVSPSVILKAINIQQF